MSSKHIKVCHAGLGDCVTIHCIVISTERRTPCPDPFS